MGILLFASAHEARNCDAVAMIGVSKYTSNCGEFLLVFCVDLSVFLTPNRSLMGVTISASWGCSHR